MARRVSVHASGIPGSSFDELVLRWIGGAVSVPTSEKSSILARQVESNGKVAQCSIVELPAPPDFALRAAAMAEKLQSLPEGLAHRTKSLFRAGDVEPILADGAILSTTVRSHCEGVNGRDSVASELAKQCEEFGPVSDEEVWQQSQYVMMCKQLHETGVTVFSSVRFNEGGEVCEVTRHALLSVN